MCHCTACSSKSPFIHNSSFDITYDRYHMNGFHVKLYIYCSSFDMWGVNHQQCIVYLKI